MSWLNNPVDSMLQKSLDALWARNTTISENIANIDTPDYKRKYVEFESLLKDEVDNIKSDMKKKNVIFSKDKIASRLSSVNAQVKTDDDLTMRVDGNGIDYDRESTDLAKAQLQYIYGTRLMTDSFARIKAAIKG